MALQALWGQRIRGLWHMQRQRQGQQRPPAALQKEKLRSEMCTSREGRGEEKHLLLREETGREEQEGGHLALAVWRPHSTQEERQ
jgi:hypothetical protein